MKKMETKKLLYILGGVILVAVIAYSVYVNLNKSSQSVPTVPTSSSQSASSVVSTTKKPSASTSVPATKAYLDAIKVYKTSGYYFQFASCHGSPGTLTLKAGKKFMLDNRDGVARKLAIEGWQTFNVGPYGFAIATAPSKVGIHYITCDGGGAATILVQK